MQDAGSLAVVVAAAEVGVVVEVVDFGFAFFEAESLEHVASSAAVTSRAIKGVRRRRRRIGEAEERTGSTIGDQAGRRGPRTSTTSRNEGTRSTARSEWKADRG